MGGDDETPCEVPSENGEPILVEVEDVGLSGETRRGLSTSAVV
jgi:hypothetical protein